MLALTLVLPALALGLDALENVGVAIIVARWKRTVFAFAGLALLTAVLVVTGRFSLRDYDGAVVVVAAWVTGIVDPLDVGVDVGALAIVGLFATGLCLVLVGLTTLGNHWRAKGPLELTRSWFARTPADLSVTAKSLPSPT